jgi:nicotinamide-nucleotide amidase
VVALKEGLRSELVGLELTCKVELLCIGNELLIGKTLNTNAQWLSERITKLGGDVTRITVVGDNIKAISSAIREVSERKPDVVITSGGLGPTFDDKTLQSFSNIFKKPLRIDQNALRLVRSRYSKILRKQDLQLTRPRLKMAMLPVGARAIPNLVGTAPGVTLTEGETRFIILPGVPAELQSIFENSFTRLIKKIAGRQHFSEASIVVYGLLESQVAPMIDQVMAAIPEVYIKSHAKGGEGRVEGFIELHFSMKGTERRTVRHRIMRAITMMSELLGRSRPPTQQPAQKRIFK